MAKITYSLSQFDRGEASQGRLAVMLDKDYDIVKNSSIFNIRIKDNKEVRENYFYGAGLCRKTPGGSFVFTVDGISYTFNDKGIGVTQESSPYKLVMGTIVNEAAASGNAIATSTTSHTTRDASGDTTEVTEEAGQSVVDSLNARDTFALQALHGLFNNMGEDPATVSSSVMTHYCEQAYKWAASMMLVAANSRASFTDAQAGGTVTPSESVSLETNTDKLLNNIIVAIETLSDTIVNILIPEIDELDENNTNGLSSINSSLQDIVKAINNSNSQQTEGE